MEHNIFRSCPEKANMKICSTKPDDYRLAKKPNGDICLMGQYSFTGWDEHGYTYGGSEWRELPMMDFPNQEYAFQ